MAFRDGCDEKNDRVYQRDRQPRRRARPRRARIYDGLGDVRTDGGAAAVHMERRAARRRHWRALLRDARFGALRTLRGDELHAARRQCQTARQQTRAEELLRDQAPFSRAVRRLRPSSPCLSGRQWSRRRPPRRNSARRADARGRGAAGVRAVAHLSQSSRDQRLWRLRRPHRLAQPARLRGDVSRADLAKTRAQNIAVRTLARRRRDARPAGSVSKQQTRLRPWSLAA